MDITGRKQMEEALRENEAQYRALMEGAIQAISIVRNGRRVFTNQAYATMFGYDSLLELLGRLVMDCIAPHDRDRLRHNAAAERARGTYTCPQAAEVIRECLDDIIANTERCTRIAESVLRFAQQEPGDRWPAGLNQLVRTAVDITRHYAEQGEACITLALVPVLPMLLVNPVAIEQVLVNLIRNAVAAGNGTVRVAVRIQVVAEQPEVVIYDTGRGIAPEHLKYIFDPFYTTRHLDGGTGLGLSLTYGIITEHGGTVDIASQVGHGTTATLRLHGRLPPEERPCTP